MCGSGSGCGSPGVGLGAPWDAVTQPPHSLGAEDRSSGQQAPQSSPPTQDPLTCSLGPLSLQTEGDPPDPHGQRRRKMRNVEGSGHTNLGNTEDEEV